MPRFFQPGKTKVYFVATLASITAPSAATINAGTNLVTADLADLEGFSFANAPLDTPDYVSTFVPKVSGRDEAANSTLHFWDNPASVTTVPAARTTLAKGVIGHIVIFHYGTAGASVASGERCDVWPGISTGPSPDNSLTEAHRWHVGWAISAAPALDATAAA